MLKFCAVINSLGWEHIPRLVLYYMLGYFNHLLCLTRESDIYNGVVLDELVDSNREAISMSGKN